MTPEQHKEATPEQRKEISKILSWGRIRLFAIGAQFVGGLFLANVIVSVFGSYYLKDTDPEIQSGFRFVAVFINAIFMTIYLDRQVKGSSAIITDKIKEVLKK